MSPFLTDPRESWKQKQAKPSPEKIAALPPLATCAVTGCLFDGFPAAPHFVDATFYQRFVSSVILCFGELSPLAGSASEDHPHLWQVILWYDFLLAPLTRCPPFNASPPALHVVFLCLFSFTTQLPWCFSRHL
ncbi:hypothetical protein PAPYR_265 [Paratrimastix pyriformis]|uniref:Uncharacterized protein n=1 Tax=Paratrimastix pyriformis TaxID=342808 RepID=A0ABQ8UZ24_9EUKA|nr:hypothetical protein PAPYR_265 [Paratrimastix pyriformis]